MLKKDPVGAAAQEVRRLGVAQARRNDQDSPAKAALRRSYQKPGPRFGPQVVVEQDDRPRRLSEREREVLRDVFEGLANKEIAVRLQVSESSVKATLQQLFSKTGVRTRSQLVRVALEKYRDCL